MVNVVPCLAVVAASTIAAAVATPVTDRSISEPRGDTLFYFSDWADSIFANPETALSPEEAVKAFLDKRSSGNIPDTRSYNGDLVRDSITCFTDWTPDVSAQVSP